MATEVWKVIQRWIDAQWNKPTQTQLAERLGVSRQAVSQWRTGQSRPRPEHLRGIADATRIPYRDLTDALLADLGYLTTEEVGSDARSAPNKQAAERAANIEALRGPDPSGLDLAAETEERRDEA